MKTHRFALQTGSKLQQQSVTLPTTALDTQFFFLIRHSHGSYSFQEKTHWSMNTVARKRKFMKAKVFIFKLQPMNFFFQFPFLYFFLLLYFFMSCTSCEVASTSKQVCTVNVSVLFKYLKHDSFSYFSALLHQENFIYWTISFLFSLLYSSKTKVNEAERKVRKK